MILDFDVNEIGSQTDESLTRKGGNGEELRVLFSNFFNGEVFQLMI